VRLPESMTFAQTGMEICGYVKKYGECVKIERTGVYG